MTTLDLAIPAQLMLALVPDLVLMGGAMLLLLVAAWRPESDDASAHRRPGAASCSPASPSLLCSDLGRALSGRPGADRRRQLPLDGRRRHPARDGVRDRAEHGRQHAHAGSPRAEAHVLILLASSGMMLLAAARDLMIVFLGIEMMSISVYVLAGINRRSERVGRGRAQVLPARRVLDGVPALRHRARVRRHGHDEPHADRRPHRACIELGTSPLLLAGIALLLIGFGFKVATVPFHMWAPDVYEGAPSPVTAYMAATVKAAAFAAFIRVWLEAFPAAFDQLASGAQRARDRDDDRRQRDRPGAEEPQAPARLLEHRARRLPARRHRGRARSRASSAMLFYLFVYTLATFGAFAVVVTLTRDGRDAA